MIWILLPAYNEERALPILIAKIDAVMTHRQLGYTIIVGNDGSRDRTVEVLDSFAGKIPLEVVHHKINRGLGETSRDLFERAAELSAPDDVIVRMDCDDTHDPEIAVSMIEKLAEGYDVVIASRFQPGGGQRGLDAYRTLISRAANLFMKVFFPIKGVREYSCGYRAYRAEIIQKAIEVFGNRFIQLMGLGFTCTLEKLVKLKILKARFAEVPFVLRYDRKQGPSKMVTSVTTMGYLTMVVLYHWPWGGWRRGYRHILRGEAETKAAQSSVRESSGV